MKHYISVSLQNISYINVNGIYVRVYGDVDWDEPLRFRYGGTYVKERLRRDRCPFNRCDLIFRPGKPMAPGDVVKYSYSFNLYYYPPRDHFSLEILVGIGDVLIRIPRRYGENVRISVEEDKVVLTGYGLMDSGSVKVSVSKKYNVVHGILSAPPGILQIPIQIRL